MTKIYFSGLGDGAQFTSYLEDAYVVSFIPGDALDKEEHYDTAEVMAGLLNCINGHDWKTESIGNGHVIYREV